MNYPGDQSQQIEDYLRAKGNDGHNVSADAYKAALRIAALAITSQPKDEEEECPHDELDHGICLDCGKDCHEQLEAKADWLRERDL